MKKTYIIPETLMADLICGNILNPISPADNSTKNLNDADLAPYGKDAEVKDSKNIWDDEW
ncbi:MAG: hypothetical protein J5661_06515 [Bacteroidaceae bacterium]|nr:hypothetical protein [Bacteroidaceae bacterium]